MKAFFSILNRKESVISRKGGWIRALEGPNPLPAPFREEKPIHHHARGGWVSDAPATLLTGPPGPWKQEELSRGEA